MKQLINGVSIAESLLASMRTEVDSLPFTPILCDVMVGNNPVSLSFVNAKRRKAEAAGMAFQLVQLPAEATAEEIQQGILDASRQDSIAGLIVQLPLPPHVNQEQVLSVIPESVDVDCLSPASQQQFYNGGQSFTPPTAAAVLEVLDSLSLDWSKEKLLVIGQGKLVGKPVSELLRRRGIAFEVADESTPDTDAKIREATVIISGAGKHGVLNQSNINKGVVIVDAGTSESGGSIKGDFDPSGTESKVRAFTPVPGGVGPVSVAKLISNVLLSAQRMVKG